MLNKRAALVAIFCLSLGSANVNASESNIIHAWASNYESGKNKEEAFKGEIPPILKKILALETDKSEIGKKLKDKMNLRVKALKKRAIMLGTQAGFYVRSHEIMDEVNRLSPALDRVFNFNILMLSHGHVLPPVISELTDVVRQADDSRMVVTDRAISIAKQARLVTRVPTWRDWLIGWEPESPPDIENTPALLLPMKHEKEFWRAYVLFGYKAGIKQANDAFVYQLQDLLQTYLGMVRYHVLLMNRIISPPMVSMEHMGAVGSENWMNIGQNNVYLTVKPRMQINPAKWRALPKINNAFNEWLERHKNR